MIRKRVLYYGGGMTAYIVVVVGLFGLVSFLSNANHKQLDLTASARHTLSPQTTNLVGRLPYEIKLFAFVKDNEQQRSAPKRLIERYEYSGKNFKWEFVDPDKKPGLARDYGVTRYNTFVLTGREGKKEVLDGELNEEKLTNAMIRLISTKEHAVYFTKGHGEKDINGREPAGYDDIRTALKEQNYIVGDLLLFNDAPLPENAELLIIAGPQKSLMDVERKKVDSFIQNGGKALFLVGSFSAANTGTWLEKYGIKQDNDTIVDNASRIMGGDVLAPMVSSYEDHPVTKDFKVMTFFPLACSLKAKSDPARGIETRDLAKTRPDTWGETDEAALKAGTAKYDEGKDVAGPLTIAAVAELTTPSKDNDGKPKKGVVAVICDSEFASNAYLGVGGNKDLFMNMVNWLSSEEDRVTIASHSADSEPLILKASHISTIAVLSVAGLPLLLLSAGLWVNIRRRRSG
jgi:ABC-type uncharacterized transport system involved in gliding motility auxiliary subunit